MCCLAVRPLRLDDILLPQAQTTATCVTSLVGGYLTLQLLEQLVQGWRAVLLVLPNVREEEREARRCLELLSVGHKVLCRVQQVR